MERVGLRARLAGGRRRVVRQRDAKRPALARVERMDVARHLIRNHPLLHGVGIEQCAVDARSRSSNVASHRCGAHGLELKWTVGGGSRQCACCLDGRVRPTIREATVCRRRGDGCDRSRRGCVGGCAISRARPFSGRTAAGRRIGRPSGGLWRCRRDRRDDDAVRPVRRRRRRGAGVGTHLLQQLFEGSSRRMTFSSKHPAAAAAYRRAGMEPQWRLLYLRGEAVGGGPELPVAAWRHSRTSLVEQMASHGAHVSADVVSIPDETGVWIARLQSPRPVEVLAAALAGLPSGTVVTMCTPEHSPLAAWAQDSGFLRQRLRHVLRHAGGPHS